MKLNIWIDHKGYGFQFRSVQISYQAVLNFLMPSQ